MSYPVETKLCSKNGWFTPKESNAYYATKYARNGITVHWWGDGTGASNHDNIVRYFLEQSQAAVKSVNYVVSDKKITKMVEPDNVAWTSQRGNPTTVSIEFQPTLGTEGYKRGGWLIAELEKKYKRTLKLYKHSDWEPTDCPGTINVIKLRQEADKAKKVLGGTTMSKTDKADLDAIYLYGPLGRKRKPGEGEDVYLNKEVSFVLKDHYNSKPARDKRAAANKPVVKPVADPDGSKWRKFKELLGIK